MKRLKQKQLGPWCSYCCNEGRKRAVFHEDGWYGKFACEEHVAQLKAHEAASRYAEQRVTEADYQTWMKL